MEKSRPGRLWLIESAEPVFAVENRTRGMVSRLGVKGYLEGRASLGAYAASVSGQEAVCLNNYVKLRYLKNHDNA